MSNPNDQRLSALLTALQQSQQPVGDEFGIPDDVIAQISALGSIPDRQQQMQQQLAQGLQQRGAPSPDGSKLHTMFGDAYTAASPLEHLATALSRVQGARQAQGAQQGLQDSFSQQDAGRGAYARMALQPGQQVSPLVKALVGQRLQMQGMGPSNEFGPLYGPGF